MGAKKILLGMMLGFGSLLGAAAPALATVTTTSIAAPADGTQLFLNNVANPNQMFTVSGTSDGTSASGDSVDIQCYEVNSHLGGYMTGIPVDVHGNFSASIPVSDFPSNTCHLLAVPHGTTPQPSGSYNGPRVSFGKFDISTIPTGPNAGKAFDLTLADTTMTAQTYVSSADDCGPSTTLPKDGDQQVTVSGYVFNCAGSFFNSTSDFGVPTDLTRSEIQVDGQNAYGAFSAGSLFTGSENLSGFPGLTATLDSSDPSTGNVQATDLEPLVKCTPSDGYNPTAASCTAFGSTGVSLSRVNRETSGARVATQTDTIRSTDGATHTVDLLYETDVDSTTVGWLLPGENTFTQHGTGDTAAAPAAAPGTIFVAKNPSSPAGFTNPMGSMTFASPYNSLRFDNGLFGAHHSVLIDYQRTVPAGGCTTIAWSYGTGESPSEVQADASSAASDFAAPSLSITSPASGARTTGSVNVTGTISAASGVDCVSVNGIGATVSGTSWSATVPLAAGQRTLTATASSMAGGTQTIRTTITVDQSTPTISIAAPADGATFTQGAVVKAGYSCVDPDGSSDIATCAGPVKSGSPIDTSKTGRHSFTVAAADQAGNTVSKTVTYTVTSRLKVNTAEPASDEYQGSTVLVTPGITVACPSGAVNCSAGTTATTTINTAADVARKHSRQVVIGRATTTIPAGQKRKLTFKLDSRGLKLLRKLGRLRVKVTVISRVGHNAPLTVTKPITIKLPKKHKHKHAPRV